MFWYVRRALQCSWILCLGFPILGSHTAVWPPFEWMSGERLLFFALFSFNLCFFLFFSEMLKGVRSKTWVECKGVGGSAVICQVWIQQASVLEGFLVRTALTVHIFFLLCIITCSKSSPVILSIIWAMVLTNHTSAPSPVEDFGISFLFSPVPSSINWFNFFSNTQQDWSRLPGSACLGHFGCVCSSYVTFSWTGSCCKSQNGPEIVPVDFAAELGLPQKLYYN